MNLLLFDREDLVGENRIAVTGRRLMHLRQVLKAEPGKVLRLGEINGRIGRGEVKEISEERAVLQFELTDEPPCESSLAVLIALPRPKSLPRIVQTLTMLGVKEIFFIHSYKVSKDFWSSDYLSKEVLDHAARLGLEQAMDTKMPVIEFRRRFKPFVEDELPGLMENRLGFVAHPYDAEACPERNPARTMLAIGPEGGWIDYELEMLQERGFHRVQCAQRILRLETAITVLISRLSNF